MKTNYTHQPIRAYEKPGEWGTIQYTSISYEMPAQNAFIKTSESETKKKYIVALSMARNGYISPIAYTNSQSINSNIKRVYYCDENTLMPLIGSSIFTSIFNVDPVEQGFDYIEGEDLQSLDVGGQQFPANNTAFFYELEDDSYIEDYMFYGQDFMIFVPDTITSIGDYAFYTEGTTDVFMKSETPPEKQEYSFDLISLNVFTQTAAEAYCSAWGLFVAAERDGIYLLKSIVDNPTT